MNDAEILSPALWESLASLPLSSTERRARVTDVLERAALLVPREGVPAAELEAETRGLDLRHIPPEDGEGIKKGSYMLRRRLHGFHTGDPPPRPIYSLNAYVHRILREDFDEAPHNHPWEWAVSLVLRGHYVEKREFPPALGGSLFRSRVPGTVNQFAADTFHRIVEVSDDCWTLFVTGPKTNGWGFDVPGRGFVPWRERLRERGIEPQY